MASVARACARGGARLLEFTNRGDFAWEVFRELERFCARELPEMITGVADVFCKDSDSRTMLEPG